MNRSCHQDESYYFGLFSSAKSFNSEICSYETSNECCQVDLDWKLIDCNGLSPSGGCWLTAMPCPSGPATTSSATSPIARVLPPGSDAPGTPATGISRYDVMSLVTKYPFAPVHGTLVNRTFKNICCSHKLRKIHTFHYFFNLPRICTQNYFTNIIYPSLDKYF